MIRHFRMLRMLLLSSIATMAMLPDIVVRSPLFAQSREGKEWGQLMCPLLCCGGGPQIQMEWWQAMTVLVVIVIILIFLGVMAEYAERDAKRRSEEQSDQPPAPEDTPNVVGKWVRFNLDGAEREGVVVHQHEDILSVNFLSDNGQLSTTNVEYAKVTLK